MNLGGIGRNLAVAFELGRSVIIGLLVILLIHFFIGTIFVVDGASMEPNFHTGEVVWVNKLAYLTASPKRGDTVVLRFPGDPQHSRYIKRIIGMPGERVIINNGKVFVNGKELLEVYIPKETFTEAEKHKNILLAPEEYFLVGDNRLNSSDGRTWGPARKEDLIGRTRLILLPPKYTGYIPDVFYN